MFRIHHRSSTILHSPPTLLPQPPNFRESTVPRSDALTHLGDWFDHRLGYRAGCAVVSRHLRPRRPRWGLALAVSTMAMLLVVAVTGVALMSGYSPAYDHGWSSVFLIESTPGGSFLRGLHYFGSHALIIMVAVLLARAILAASFRAPRDLAWIAAVLLLPLLATAAVTGNPLSASNDAVGQIEVEGHILGAMPLIGPILEGILIGGEQVGHLTMTRLYTLHVVLLPLLAGLLLVLHIHQQIRWAGASSDESDTKEASEDAAEATSSRAPGQGARNALVFGIAFAVVAWLAWQVGVPLEVPADPRLQGMPRPEWYFRSLFELRHLLSGTAEFVATGLVPMLFLLLLILLPVIDRFLPRMASAIFRYSLVIVVTIGWCGLTFQSFARDRADPVYQGFLAQSEQLADRAKQLARASEGVPPAGPAALLRSDPKTQGPRLFQQHCANCHSHVNEAGEGIVAKTPAASNLYRFGSRDWVAGILDPEQLTSGEYFGHTAFVKGFATQGMMDYVKNVLYNVPKEQLEKRREDVHKIVLALSAEANLSYQRDEDLAEAKAIGAGRKLLLSEELGCVNCHVYGEKGTATGPDLTGYGSRNWLREFIANPNHERFYPTSNDGMPAFRPDPNSAGSPDNILSERELLLIVDWLRRDWVGVGGGEETAVAER